MPRPRATHPLRNPIATRLTDDQLTDTDQRRGTMPITDYLRWCLDKIRELDLKPG